MGLEWSRKNCLKSTSNLIKIYNFIGAFHNFIWKLFVFQTPMVLDQKPGTLRVPFAKLPRGACLATPKYCSDFTQRPASASDYGDAFWTECCVGRTHDDQWWVLGILGDLWIHMDSLLQCEATSYHFSLTWFMIGNKKLGIKSVTIYPQNGSNWQIQICSLFPKLFHGR